MKKIFALSVLVLFVSVQVGLAGKIQDAIADDDLALVQNLLDKNPKLIHIPDDEGIPPLCLAVKGGCEEIVRELLKRGADIHKGDLDNSQAIHYAAIHGEDDIAQLLLEKGAKVDERDVNGVTPLIFAASFKQTSSAEFYLEKGADVNAVTKPGYSALLHAVIGGNQYLVKALLANGADVNIRGDGGIVPLHSACSYGRNKIFNILLEHGADIHAENDHGETPLMWALNPNCYEIAKCLIDKGADVHHKSKYGSTALHNAARRGTLSIVKLHLEHGVDVNAMDQHGWTPLIGAAFANADVVKFLLDNGAKVNTGKSEEMYWTALLGAVRRGSPDMVKMLVEKGADVNAVNEEGMLPLHAAVGRGDRDIVETLVNGGADVTMHEKMFGYTPLHVAAVWGHRDIADRLIESGAEVTAADNAGKTPMDYALYHGFRGVAKLLAKAGADKGKLEKKSPCCLGKEYANGEATVWYLGHSGWAIKTRNHLLVFDYFLPPGRTVPEGASLASGYIVPCELMKQNVCVFTTHGHADHYQEGIFDWQKKIPDIEYVMGFKPQGHDGEYTYIGPRTAKKVDGMKISTIKANDAGVGFVVEVDGLTIFHSGDHANGRVDLAGTFPPEIDYLAEGKLDIDLAFFGITGCSLGDPESVREGVFYAMKKLKPRVVIPMHGGNSPWRYLEFAEKAKEIKSASKVICAINEGDRFFYKGGVMSMN
jgi:ankyrin repeat protein/L-ascorbate metabolism protein UlaG (beta-lactamase superfamily)